MSIKTKGITGKCADTHVANLSGCKITEIFYKTSKIFMAKNVQFSYKIMLVTWVAEYFL